MPKAVTKIGVSLSPMARLIVLSDSYTEDPVDLIYSLLPAASLLSLTTAALLVLRAATATIHDRCLSAARPRCGRKALLVSACSTIFTLSCVYRSLNIADEGAFLCRTRATAYNAPVSGRLVATLGELALVVQVRSFIEEAARRLRVARIASAWTVAPTVVAETFSWLGVLTGVSRFFCAEYCCWVVIAGMWAWDAAELLHKSRRATDAIVHALLVCASLSLIAFNVLHELPHFFSAVPLTGNSDVTAGPATRPSPTPFSCTHERDSPIWTSRLPFFVTYFVGASACSATLAARHHAIST